MNKLICELGKRTLVLNGKEYQIEQEIAKWIIHNTNIKVVYKLGILHCRWRNSL